jgi:hypothetical protein
MSIPPTALWDPSYLLHYQYYFRFASILKTFEAINPARNKLN